MSMDVFRALIADTISTMSVEELRNIILKTPDKELGAVGAAVLAEKGKKAIAVAPAEDIGDVMRAVSVEEEEGPRRVVAPVAKARSRKKKAVGRSAGTRLPVVKAKAARGNREWTGICQR